MHVVVLRNSIAGRGEGRREVDAMVGELTAAGHESVIIDVNRGVARDEALAAALRDATALVIAGGDGTVHHAAPLALEADVPLIHFPMGTENLFAREFGHTRSPASVVAAVRKRAPRRVDIGYAGPRPFLLMASAGFDSCVVERLAAARRGAISRMTYVHHSTAEFIRPRFVPLTVRVDGREIVRDQPGMVVIANSRQYAARLDPARHASMTDGALDVVFLPIASRFDILRRTIQVSTGRHLSDPTILTAKGREIVLTPAAGLPLQLDGEFAGLLAAGREATFTLRPSSLGVLLA